MAKCIRVVGQGVPVRLSDADAFQIVARDFDGQYCPKHVWKAHMANEYSPNYRTTGLAKLNGRKIVEVDTLHFNAQHKRRKVA